MAQAVNCMVVRCHAFCSYLAILQAYALGL